MKMIRYLVESGTGWFITAGAAGVAFIVATVHKILGG